MWISDRWKDFELLDCSDGENWSDGGTIDWFGRTPKQFGRYPGAIVVGVTMMPATAAAIKAAEIGRKIGFRRAGIFNMVL